MKFTDAPFTITKKYSDELRSKIAIFRTQTKTRKTVHFVFVAANGIVQNRYAAELVDRVVTMDALFMQGALL